MRRNILKAIGSIMLGIGMIALAKSPAFAADCPAVPFVPSGYACSASETCPIGAPSGCDCNGGTIAAGTVCTMTPPSDGNIGSNIAYGTVCGDADGCYCNTYSPFVVPLANICTRNATPPSLTASSVTPSSTSATFTFTSTEAGTISYQGSCGNGSLSSASAGSNTITYSSLTANTTYNNCTLRVTDTDGNISSYLSVPTFVTATSGGGTVTPPVTPPTGGGGGSVGGGGSRMCTTSQLVCKNGFYEKASGTYCLGGDLGKACDAGLPGIVSTVPGLTMTGLTDLIEKTKNNALVITTTSYTFQGITIKFYTPKYKNYSIKKVILQLNTSIKSQISKKLTKVTDPAYYTENYEKIGTDMKIYVQKEAGALLRTWNDFMAVFFLYLDGGRKDLLPVAQYLLKTFLVDYIEFKKI